MISVVNLRGGAAGIIEFVLPKFSGEERKEEDKIRICHIKK